jgi:hypothetical protein
MLISVTVVEFEDSPKSCLKIAPQKNIEKKPFSSINPGIHPIQTPPKCWNGQGTAKFDPPVEDVDSSRHWCGQRA